MQVLMDFSYLFIKKLKKDLLYLLRGFEAIFMVLVGNLLSHKYLARHFGAVF